jgi:hypothetical protein
LILLVYYAQIKVLDEDCDKSEALNDRGNDERGGCEYYGYGCITLNVLIHF